MTNFELLRVLEGHALTVKTTAGRDVVVRLMLAEELAPVLRAAQQEFRPESRMSDRYIEREAIRLTRPLPKAAR